MRDRPAIADAQKLAGGFLLVLTSMMALFLLPPGLFVAATFASMSCMIAATYVLTRYSGLFRPRAASLGLGFVSAAALYLLFYLGNAGIVALHPLGLSAST